MSKTKFTPGPWVHDDTWGLIMAGKVEVTALHSGNQANAALISAAPEMYEALEVALGYLPDVKIDDVFLQDQIQLILAKARGES